MGNVVTSEFVSDNQPREDFHRSKYSFEESLSCRAIAFLLQIHVNDIPILVNSSPEIMLYSLNFDEHFIEEKRIAESILAPSQSSRVLRPKLMTPSTNGLVSYLNAAFGHQIFNIASAEIETVVQSDDVLNNVGRESMAFVH